ncbi:MAG: hypothetical protein K2G83_06340 [Ruminococcus sp.]|nr:hypothetical protein [Ruminococcus sp.]
MNEKICLCVHDSNTKSVQWFYQGKIVDLYTLFDPTYPPSFCITVPMTNVYLTYKGIKLPPLLLSPLSLNEYYELMSIKKLAIWSVKHYDVTKSLFKKYDIKCVSINKSFNSFSQCTDMNWGLLLADLINQCK